MVNDLAARLGLRPTKQWGQNFVVDANTVRRIVRLSRCRAGRRRRRGRSRPRLADPSHRDQGNGQHQRTAEGQQLTDASG